jgi:DNA-binding CsgD family transcriptional regulator
MATECEECGTQASKADGVVVGEVWGGYGPICNECWSMFLADETTLSQREADVAALKDLGNTHAEIADILGIDKSTVGTYVGRIVEKVVLAERTADELGHMSPETGDN